LLGGYERLRRFAIKLGVEPYDPPIIGDDVVSLRYGYAVGAGTWDQWDEKGDWSSDDLVADPNGLVAVWQSLVHERSIKRSNEFQAAFSDYEAAAKYVLFRLGGDVRADAGLPDLPLLRPENNPAITIRTLSDSDARWLIAIRPEWTRGVSGIRESYRRFERLDQPGFYAIASRDDGDLGSIMYSFDELHELLTTIP